MIYLDTHVLVWLWLNDTAKLGREARKAIDSQEIVAPAAAVLELGILHELGRLKHSAATVMSGLAETLRLRICDLSFRTIVDQALAESWTRDPFDRLIVANAKAAGAALITKDQRMHEHYKRAVW